MKKEKKTDLKLNKLTKVDVLLKKYIYIDK